MIGTKLGRYIINEEVGQGGMSVVYRGHDTVLDRTVAVKVLHPHLSNREDSKQRFQREARAVAKLSHPNIMQVFDFSEENAKQSFIIMEFLEGCTLREYLDKQPLEHPEIAAMFAVQICEALQHAHTIGIIHRDIKPENVMIGEGALKLTDFGIAQMVDAQAMTVTGALLGSPAHMCPEMIEGHALDFRADLFSLGTVLYYAATGELPFSGKNAPLVLKAILEGDYVDAEMISPRVGRHLSRIIDGCLERSVDDRYASVGELRSDLMDYLKEVGLENVDSELEAFFTRPIGYQADLREQLLESLEILGTRAVKERRVGAAIEYFNRVLAIEPEHERVLKLIKRIDQRRKMLVYIGIAAVLLLAASLVVAISSLVGEETEARVTAAADAGSPDVAVVALDEPDAGEAEIAAETIEPIVIDPTTTAAAQGEAVVKTSKALAGAIGAERDRREADKKGRERPSSTMANNRVANTNNASKTNNAANTNGDTNGGEKEEVAVEASSIRLVTLKLNAFPHNAEFKVGSKTYTADEARKITLNHDISLGNRIKVTITHPRCKRHTLFIDALKEGDNISRNVQLEWKDAILKVQANRKAIVLVTGDGGFSKRFDASKELKIPILEMMSPTRTVSVTVVSSTGGKPVNVTPTMTAGQRTIVPANFK